MDLKQFPVPVTHELGMYLHGPDISLYHSVVSFYKREVADKDPYNYSVTLCGKKFKFFSKPGGLINPKNNQRMFEYILHYKSEDGASKCSITITGLINGVKTVTGKIHNSPFPGTQLHTQSSYFSPIEIENIIKDFFILIDSPRFSDTIDKDKSVIYQCARHVRYHQDSEKDMVQLLKAIKEQSSTYGDHELVEKCYSGMYDMYKISIPSLDFCNAETDYVQDIKTYRIKNFLERSDDDPLKHPKLEVFLNNPEQSKKKTVSLNEYYKLVYDQDRLISRLFHMLQKYTSYVKDSYFDPSKTYSPRWSLPTYEYHAVKIDPEFELPDNNNQLRFLAEVAFSPSGSCLIQDIIERTKMSESTAYRYLRMFKATKILDSVRSTNTIVFFTRASIWSSVQKSLASLSNHLKFGYSYLYGSVCRHTDEIRPYAERYKNDKPVMQLDDSPITVETEKDFNRLKNEFAKYGIKRRILISHIPFFYGPNQNSKRDRSVSTGTKWLSSGVY